MKIKKSLSSIGLALSFVALLTSCDNTAKDNGEDKSIVNDKSELTIHELGDPDGPKPSYINSGQCTIHPKQSILQIVGVRSTNFRFDSSVGC